jgi:hypothetical protein
MKEKVNIISETRLWDGDFLSPSLPDVSGRQAAIAPGVPESEVRGMPPVDSTNL